MLPEHKGQRSETIWWQIQISGSGLLWKKCFRNVDCRKIINDQTGEKNDVKNEQKFKKSSNGIGSMCHSFYCTDTDIRSKTKYRNKNIHMERTLCMTLTGMAYRKCFLNT